MRTVAETAIFQRYASEVRSEVERIEFINWIAANPEAGDVIRGSGAYSKPGAIQLRVEQRRTRPRIRRRKAAVEGSLPESIHWPMSRLCPEETVVSAALLRQFIK